MYASYAMSTLNMFPVCSHVNLAMGLRLVELIKNAKMSQTDGK